MSYATILFDLDHTLLDSDTSLAGAYDTTMRDVGVDDPAAVYSVFDRINQALWRRVEAHEMSPNEVRVRRFEELIAELGLDADAGEMAKAFVRGLVECGELLPGARDLLDGLAGRRRLALVTNGIGKVQRGRLERLGLDRYFDVVTISGEVDTNKPGKEIFELTFDALGIRDRSQIVMVGDNLGSDIAGGFNVGIDTIWFNPDNAPHPADAGFAEVADGGPPAPTHTVRQLSEVGPLV